MQVSHLQRIAGVHFSLYGLQLHQLLAPVLNLSAFPLPRQLFNTETVKRERVEKLQVEIIQRRVQSVLVLRWRFGGALLVGISARLCGTAWQPTPA